MRSWTLFVDESGLFEPRGMLWLPGMRLVGGVLVPLSRGEAEPQLETVLRAALSAAGASWWRGPVHCREIAHWASLAVSCQAEEAAPAGLREAAARRQRADQMLLRQEGQRMLASLRAAVGQQVQALGGYVITVCEHGAASGAGSALPYSRMARALIDTAMLRAATQNGPAATFQAVVAERGGSAMQAYSSPWQRYLRDAAAWFASSGDSSGLAGLEQLPTVVERAEASAGLQAADVVVHSLGPGAGQELAPTDLEVRSRTRAAVEAEARLLLSVEAAHVEEHDGSLGHQAERDVLAECPNDGRFRAAVRRARALPPVPLPQGLFPASLEQAAATARALEEARGACSRR